MSRNNRVRMVVMAIGGGCGALLALISLAMMIYYGTTLGWLDGKVFAWEIYPPIGIVIIFFFTRVVDPILENVLNHFSPLR